MWRRALSGEEFTQIGEFGDPGRDRRFYEMKFNVLRNPKGKLIGAYQFVVDVTDRPRYSSSDDDSHPFAHPQGAMLDATSACPGDVEARLAIGRHAEIVRAYGRSFDPAAG